MIQLARLDRTVTDSSGNAVVGATVEIRRQGATVQGAQTKTTGQAIDVDALGSLAASDQVRIYRGGTVLVSDSAGGTLFTVSTTSPASSPKTVTLTWASGGTLSLSDEDRLSNISSTPTLYNDAMGNESTGSSSLTSSNTGQILCWLAQGHYDRLTTIGSSIKLIEDDLVVSVPFVTGSEALAAAATVSITKNLVRFTSSTANVQTIRIDGAAPDSIHDGFPVSLVNKSGGNVIIEHNTGNVFLSAASNMTLADHHSVALVWSDSDSAWVQGGSD